MTAPFYFNSFGDMPLEKGIKLFEKAFGTRRTALDEVSEKYGWSGGNVGSDVQRIEGFERGANEERALAYVRKKAKDDKNYLDAKKNKQGEVFIDKYLINAYNKVYGNVNNIEDVAELAYSAFYGEREARDVQKRMDMTTKMRKNNFPSNFENEITHTWGDYNNELQGNASVVLPGRGAYGIDSGGRTGAGEVEGKAEESKKREITTAGRTENSLTNDFQFAAPVMINGKKGYMGVSVRVTDGNKYKMHRVLFPDGATLEFTDNKNVEATDNRAADIEKIDGSRNITSTPEIITEDASDVKNDFRFSTPVAAETQQEFGEITTRRAYDYFKKNRNSYKKEIGRMFGELLGTSPMDSQWILSDMLFCNIHKL